MRLGVTGTDTGVGKTLVAAALLVAARQRGERVAAMKPVETGASDGPTDAERLTAAAGGGVATDLCPYRFSEPLAPLVAARRVGRVVDLDVLDAAFQRLSRERDVVVVEGAGGLLVPVLEAVTYAELFARWRLDVLVVAANRLGALNHALLTIREAERAGLAVRAVVLNTLTAAPSDLSQATNAATLAELLPHVPIVSWPYLSPADRRDLETGAASSELANVLWGPCPTPTSLTPEYLERGT